jgi:peptidyl-prolyl cis-trans isomerase SurA
MLRISVPFRRFHLSAISILMAASVAAPAQTVVERIVARVNDQIISQSDLKRERENLQQELKQQNQNNNNNEGDSSAKFAAHEKDLLRDLIDAKLLVQKGKELGTNVDNEVVKQLDDMRKQMNLESMDDLEKAAAAQGVSFEDYKANIRDNMIKQRVIGEEVGRRLQILPSEVSKFYEDHKKEMEQPESVELAEILASTQAPAKDAKDPKAEQPANPEEDAARVTAAEAKARQMLEQLKKGAKFEDVAKASSDGPSAADGGALGEFKRGQLAKELEDKVFPLKDNETTDIIRTRQGFIILKVLAHHAAGVPPLKDVQNQIYETIYYQKLQPALREYLTKLREDAFIKIEPGFVDSGASPNQTNFDYTTTASNAEGSKKPKRKKKLGIF